MDYLFKKWNEIKAKLKDKYLFIFLDFDGTLIPIAATPEKAVLPGSTKKLLEKISKSQRLKMAFISGRALDNIEQKIGLRDVIYSGNHGLEIEGPGIKFRPLVPPGYRKVLERIK
ncbi:MAG: trehalose-phosphatase, partial [Deltaproteobacteria bacterium]